MLKNKIGKIKKDSISKDKITLTKSIFDVLLEGIVLIIISILLITTTVVLANYKVIPESIVNSFFPVLCVLLLVLLGKYFITKLFKTPYIICFNIPSKKIERLNINSNIIDSETFEDHQYIITNDSIDYIITLCNEKSGIAYNIVLASENITTKTITDFVKENFKAMKTDGVIVSTFECIHCKHEQSTDFDYCPKCGKNDDGKINTTKFTTNDF